MFPHLLSGWINLPELHELIVVFTAHFRNESTLVFDVLGHCALPVASIADGAHEAETLSAAGEASNKRSRAFVLPALHLYSCACCCCHNAVILAQ